MGLFKIKYIDRSGHRAEDTVIAKTRRLARRKAEDLHDDILSVRRSSFHWSRILLYLLIAAGVIALFCHA